MTPRLYLCLLVLGHLGAVLSCRVGTLEECQAAPFVPGHNLAGGGFDIVKLQKKGAYMIDLQTFLDSSDSCTLCENPLQGDKLHKLPLSVLDWRAFTSCKMELSSSLLATVTSVADSATDVIENDWTVGLGLGDIADLTVGGSHSNEVEFATDAYMTDKSVFTSHQFSCSHYRWVKLPKFSRTSFWLNIFTVTPVTMNHTMNTVSGQFVEFMFFGLFSPAHWIWN